MPAVNEELLQQRAKDLELARCQSQQHRYIMRLAEVMADTGYKRSSIYLFMSRGDFPKCRRIGPRAVGWDSLEIAAWIAQRLEG